MFGAYDELLEHLVSGTTFPPDLVTRFGEQLRVLVEPGLEPYYRLLSPSFFGRFLPTRDPASLKSARG
jgi:hypothetical protein